MTSETPDRSQAALAYCPFPDGDSARRIAGQLLSERLIACANIVPNVESVFEYNGEISTAIEVSVLFKTTSARLNACVARLGELHPYDTPAVVGWRCDTAYPATLAWLESTVVKP
ncbi:divalent cation tolerance protein CutA [Erythrobacter sp. Alg231-14]|uniref:divalent cation tolerance protein CutA n=1 Tax=Erythrobacter sp. Alg231-14 TaxID=1922225 RepID=UPI000D55EB10